MPFDWNILGQSIYGEYFYDYCGFSVSLSADGTRVAVGAMYNDGSSTNINDNKGHVRVFQYNSTTLFWSKLGQDIDGEASGDNSGYSVSLSADGTRVAIGAIYNDGSSTSINDNKGHVRVFQYNSTTLLWSKLGQDIDGEYTGDNSGYSVSLSADGTMVAIGAINNDGSSTSINDNRGHVRVYQYNSTTLLWTRLGQDIDGDKAGDCSGYSVSMSADGSTIIIGAIFNDGLTTNLNDNRGQVKIYQYNTLTQLWIQKGHTIYGENNGDFFGWSVSVNNNGTIIGIGSTGFDGNGANSGCVKLFKWSNTTWTQMGQTMNGEYAGDQFGYSISLSSNGYIVAIGASYNDGTTNNNNDNKGHVRIYKYNTKSAKWIQIGQDIDGDNSGYRSGYSLSVSADGSIVAIGATMYSVYSIGQVKVLTYPIRNGVDVFKRDPIKEMCKNVCEVIPLKQTYAQKSSFSSFINRTKYKRVYQGKPSQLTLLSVEFDTLEITFSPVGTPEYYEIYLRQLPNYNKLAPYTFYTNRGILTNLQVNTTYEIDVIAYYITGQKFSLDFKQNFTTLNESAPGQLTISTPTGLLRYTDRLLFFNIYFEEASGSPIQYSLDVSFQENGITSHNTYSVLPKQNNRIPNIIADKSYTFTLTTLYTSTLFNPDYSTIPVNKKMINEGPATNIIVETITGTYVKIQYTKSPQDLDHDISYNIQIVSGTYSAYTSFYYEETDPTIIDISFHNLINDLSYDINIISYYPDTNNSYLIQSSFKTLNEYSVPSIQVISYAINATISIISSPGFTANDTYTLSLFDTSYNNVLLGFVDIPGDVNSFNIASIFPSYLYPIIEDNSYNLQITSYYQSSGNYYATQKAFKTLLEGVIDNCTFYDFTLTGSSVKLNIVPFRNSNPQFYIIQFSSNGSNFSTTRNNNDLLFDNLFTKNTVYDVSITAVYSSLNSYSKNTVDVTFQTRNEEALTTEYINIIPFGTSIQVYINYPFIQDISSSFDYEVIDIATNNVVILNTVSSIYNPNIDQYTTYINTLESNGHSLDYNKQYSFKLYSKFGSNPVRLYYSYKQFTTLNEFPLYITTSKNFTINGRSTIININGTEDISFNTGMINYEVRLDNELVSGTKNIFPITFSDLLSNSNYKLLIRSTFTDTSHIYDYSVNFITQNQSELSNILFISPSTYNPYPSILVDTSYINPGFKYTRATLYSPSGTFHDMSINLYRYNSSNNTSLTLSKSYDFSSTFLNSSYFIIDFSNLDVNTKYKLEAITNYSNGNQYTKSNDFTTLNENSADIKNNFYIYTTNNTLSIDFIETGTSQTYITNISGSVFPSQTNAPLDYDISLTMQSYRTYIDTVYSATQNKYRSLPFYFIPGFTVEQFIRNGIFYGDYETIISTNKFTKSIPSDWSLSKSMIITKNSETDNGFFKFNSYSQSTYIAILYLPSNLNDSIVLVQPIKQFRGPNYDLNDNNLYKGFYMVNFYVALHKESGTFSFGSTIDPKITYDVILYNTAPPTIIASHTLEVTSEHFKKQSLLFTLNETYENVQFKIQRNFKEKNNLYIMDVSMTNLRTTDFSANNVYLSDISNIPGLVALYTADPNEQYTTHWMNRVTNGFNNAMLNGNIGVALNTGDNGSTKQFPYLYGYKESSLTINQWFSNAENYTFIHITKYNGNTQGRIWDGIGANWLSGFHFGKYAYYHNGWIPKSDIYPTEFLNSKMNDISYNSTIMNWVLSIDTIKKVYIQDSYNNLSIQNNDLSLNGLTGISINNGEYSKQRTLGSQNSDWACAFVAIYDRVLTESEINQVKTYISNKYF
jgi:hypothetical protein